MADEARPEGTAPAVVPAGPPCTESSVGFLLGRVKTLMLAGLEQFIQPLDLSAQQWVILIRIANNGMRTSAQLCRDIHYDTGSMTRMLDRLEEKGLIRRERSAKDRRVVELALTAQGEALIPALRAAGRDINNLMLQGFDSAEQTLFKAMLERMQNNLTGAGETSCN